MAAKKKRATKTASVVVDTRINFLVTAEEDRAIREAAAGEQMKLSEWLRAAARDRIAKSRR